MMHAKRRWVLSSVSSIEELARMLKQTTWTLCSGFYVEGHRDTIFLNDATHEDGAAEFGIERLLRSGEWIQVESITFSWTDEAKAAQFIRAGIAGEMDANDFARPVDLAGRLDTPEEHRQRHCHLCA
jgi:hypothetical protein